VPAFSGRDSASPSDSECVDQEHEGASASDGRAGEQVPDDGSMPSAQVGPHEPVHDGVDAHRRLVGVTDDEVEGVGPSSEQPTAAVRLSNVSTSNGRCLIFGGPLPNAA